MDAEQRNGVVVQANPGAQTSLEEISDRNNTVLLACHTRKEQADFQSKRNSQMIIDHICIAVKHIKEGIAYWEKVFGYKQMTGIVENSLQKVKVVFMSKDNSLLIKLIEPVEGNQSLLNFVNRGGGFHHICFRCEDMSTTMGDHKDKGLLTLVPPQPGEAFNNHDIAFLLGKYGMNIELIDTEDKASLIPPDPVID